MVVVVQRQQRVALPLQMMMLFWGVDQRRSNVMDRDRPGRVLHLLLVFEVRDLQGVVVDEEEEEAAAVFRR